MTSAHLLGRALLRIASLLVPEPERRDWLAEWRSELWHLLNGSSANLRDSLRFCQGAYPDAFWMRRNREHAAKLRLRSAASCLTSLAVLATTAILLVLCFPTKVGPLAPQVLMVPFAVFLLPLATRLELGEYPANHSARVRRWSFLVAKFMLVVPLVFCGTVAAGHILCASPIQPHGALVGYVLAFRWVLIDQRRRCPVCLRRVTSPAQMGQPAHNFLEWHGTEFMCPRGHGLLYVPQTYTTSLGVQRWVYLDPSWRSLF